MFKANLRLIMQVQNFNLAKLSVNNHTVSRKKYILYLSRDFVLKLIFCIKHHRLYFYKM